MCICLLFAGLVLQPGCSVYHLAKRTLYCELNEYPPLTDGKLSCRQYQRWAKQEWQRVRGDLAEPCSHDYVSGFLQGFVDQVYAGGDPIAPPVPPRKYWRIGYRNERGRRAIEDWYHGFEHGAQVAHEGGYREKAVVPSSLIPGSGQDLRLREGYDGEPVLVPENLGPEELQPPIDVTDSPEDSIEEERSAALPSILPVSFEAAESPPENRQEATWGDAPPPPPWRQTAESSNDESASSDEFDPFSGSAAARPEATTTDAREATAVGLGLQLEPPRNSDAASKDISPNAFTETPDQAPEPTPAAAPPDAQDDVSRVEGWQNKTEPTPWQSRD